MDFSEDSLDDILLQTEDPTANNLKSRDPPTLNLASGLDSRDPPTLNLASGPEPAPSPTSNLPIDWGPGDYVPNHGERKGENVYGHPTQAGAG